MLVNFKALVVGKELELLIRVREMQFLAALKDDLWSEGYKSTVNLLGKRENFSVFSLSL